MQAARFIRSSFAAGIALLVVAGFAKPAVAQRSSLFHQDLPPGAGPMLRLPTTSWTYRPIEPPKEIRIHDLITVIVDEKSQVTSAGKVDTKKNARLDMQIKDFIKLDGTSLKPAEQLDGNPRVNGTLDGQFKADTNLESRDGMKFRIGSKVLDIRPNGTLVLEGHRTIRNNEEIWELSLTGTVRREDILPNNTVFSENIAELNIEKRERGQVRDAYRRRWFYKLYDQIAPF